MLELGGFNLKNESPHQEQYSTSSVLSDSRARRSISTSTNYPEKKILGVLWSRESDLPAPIVLRVNAWCTGLQELGNVKIQRCYRRQIEIPVYTQLHVFTDASKLGFGAVAYLRFVYADDGVEVAFLMTKTHVTQLKKRTILELELKGACEGVYLARGIANELPLDYRKVSFHTDSKTVVQ